MTDSDIIKKTKLFVKKKLGTEPTGHDWFHVERVYKNSLLIAKGEKNIDLLTVKLVALLQDIADWKFNDDEKEGGKVTRLWLKKII